MKHEFRIGSRVTTMFGGLELSGTVVGRHGSIDYYAVRLETGEIVYRYGADLTAAEAVEILIIDDIPGMIIEPKELPEQEIPEDFNI